MVPIWYWHLWAQKIFITGAGLKEAQRENQSLSSSAREKDPDPGAPVTQPKGELGLSDLNELSGVPPFLNMIPWLSGSLLTIHLGLMHTRGCLGDGHKDSGHKKGVQCELAFCKNTRLLCLFPARQLPRRTLESRVLTKPSSWTAIVRPLPSPPWQNMGLSSVRWSRGCLWTRKHQVQAKAGILSKNKSIKKTCANHMLRPQTSSPPPSRMLPARPSPTPARGLEASSLGNMTCPRRKT